MSMPADDELIGVGASVMAHRYCFATPDQLRTARAEATPTAKRQLSRPSIRRSVPAFHRLDGETIAQNKAIDLQRLHQRRSITGDEILVTRNRDVQRSQVPLKCLYVAYAAETQERFVAHSHSD